MAMNVESILIYFSCILSYSNLRLYASKLIHTAISIYLPSHKSNTFEYSFFVGELPQLTNDVLQMTYMGHPICAYFKNEGTVRKKSSFILEQAQYKSVLCSLF